MASIFYCLEFLQAYGMLRKIQKWFYNHYSNPRCEYIKFTHKWSARIAFHQLNRDEVAELAKEQSGLNPGHPRFLGALQNVVTTLWNDLDNNVKADYVQVAKEWTAEAPPSHMQSRSAITFNNFNHSCHSGWQLPCASV